MIFLINFSGNRYFLASCLVSLIISGCAAARDKVSPQAVGMPPLGMQSLIAVMPVENLSGMPIQVQEVKKSLLHAMQGSGVNLLGEDAIEGFLERHRIRYTGGINRELAEALRVETGANAVLFASLELFDDTVPPKTALVARLVSTHKGADILWMDGAGMAGNDAPGFLLRGLVDDSRVLWERARDRVVDSLTGYLSGKGPQDARKAEKKFLP